MTQIDLGLAGERVCGFLFYPSGIRIMTVGGGYLASGGTWKVTWPDGGEYRFSSDHGMGKDPETGRLVQAVTAATITEAWSDESSVLTAGFDSGVRLRIEPHADNYEDWDTYSRRGFRTFAVLGAAPEQSPGPRPDSIGLVADGLASEILPPSDGERLIELDLTDRVYGVTMHAESMQLDMRSGDLFFAGPVLIEQPGGASGVFDPKFAASDESTGAVLKQLIDNTIDSALLAPDSSKLDVRFTDGLRLLWNAPTAQQGLFRARTADRREFWSKGDGSIYWYGGPEGTHPRFVVGGPKKSD